MLHHFLRPLLFLFVLAITFVRSASMLRLENDVNVTRGIGRRKSRCGAAQISRIENAKPRIGRNASKIRDGERRGLLNANTRLVFRPCDRKPFIAEQFMEEEL
jgi:hypothetical protein